MTIEQRVRDMLVRAGIETEDVQRLSAGDLVELANLVAEAEADKRRLDEIERTKNYPFWNGGVDGWIFIVAKDRSSKIERRGTGPTVREAIDNAAR